MIYNSAGGRAGGGARGAALTERRVNASLDFQTKRLLHVIRLFASDGTWPPRVITGPSPFFVYLRDIIINRSPAARRPRPRTLRGGRPCSPPRIRFKWIITCARAPAERRTDSIEEGFFSEGQRKGYMEGETGRRREERQRRENVRKKERGKERKNEREREKTITYTYETVAVIRSSLCPEAVKRAIVRQHAVYVYSHRCAPAPSST